MILTFNTHGNDKQKQVARYWCDKQTTEIGYGGSKGSGKSFLGCSLIFGSGFMYPKTHWFISRRELNDLRKYTIPSIHEVITDTWGLDQRYFKFNGQDNYFSLYNNSRVYLLEAARKPSDPDYARFGSMQMTGGWIEEGGEKGFEADAKANLSASVGRWKNDTYRIIGKLLITCNPSKNYLYPQFYLANKRGEVPAFRKFVQALPQDNKKLPPGYLEHLEQTLSPNQKQRLLYGNWEFDDDPRVLCDYQAIVDVFTNSFVDTGEVYITCDVARFGKDVTRIFVWDGWRLLQHVSMKQSSTPQTATAIKQLQAKYSIPARHVCIDEDGIGGGVVDLVPGAVGFIANHSPIYTPDDKESYGTLKDQCGFWLADRINRSQIYASELTGEDRQMCIEELEQLKARDIESDMKNRLVPKDEIKKSLNGGRSPDFLDNMIMRSYFDVMKRIQRSRKIVTH
jgi:phage terminase large subunit